MTITTDVIKIQLPGLIYKCGQLVMLHILIPTNYFIAWKVKQFWSYVWLAIKKAHKVSLVLIKFLHETNLQETNMQETNSCM